MTRKTYKEERPWGGFEQFTHNEISTVKILRIKDGEQPSVQYHHNREELWRIIGGKGKVLQGEEWKLARPGDEFFIEKGMVHTGTGDGEDLIVLEISFGNFDEKDIVRLEDKYGRPRVPE
ncbi:phosphomannose isomerase type II C-terminal cupin domain [Candidatus Woesearchaeota archaeon]|nr:phosphomannose isomerase type II C-terminal cupin domain [Candidatus Woesearchaeota archaeon]